MGTRARRAPDLKRRAREINRAPERRGLAAPQRQLPRSAAAASHLCAEPVRPRRSMPSPPAFDEGFRDRLRALLAWRRDVRRFRRDPLPRGRGRAADRARRAGALGRAQPALALCAGRRSPCDALRSAPNFTAANAAALAAQAPERAAQYAAAQACRARRGTLPPRGLCRSRHRAGARPRPPHDARDGRLFGGRRGSYLVARGAGRGDRHGLGVDPRPAGVGAILDVPPAWKLIGYFCLGYPAEEDDMPMLETAGWECAAPGASFLIRR